MRRYARSVHIRDNLWKHVIHNRWRRSLYGTILKSVFWFFHVIAFVTTIGKIKILKKINKKILGLFLALALVGVFCFASYFIGIMQIISGERVRKIYKGNAHDSN